jgi:renalase
LWDVDRDEVAATLIAASKRWIGGATVIGAQVHGWKFARPLVGLQQACIVAQGQTGVPIGFSGDAFGSSKVEGAALSGLAVAERLLDPR